MDGSGSRQDWVIFYGNTDRNIEDLLKMQKYLCRRRELLAYSHLEPFKTHSCIGKYYAKAPRKRILKDMILMH